jgi:zinc transport system substrate-binding protein
VADRFPFRYLVQDYHLTSFAAFPGCSTDSQASFSTIAFLSEKLRSLDLPGVILTESGSTSLAKTILENANSQGEIFVLDSLQSITRDQLDNGETYLTRMEYNLKILKQALGTV